jgi:hypothetical protein
MQYMYLWRGQICANKCSTKAGTARVETVSALNPVDVGACHGMTLGEIRQMLGKEQLDKAHILKSIL